jgi:mannose-6-phosphate isomerase
VVDRFELKGAREAAVSLSGPGCLVGLSGTAVVTAADGDLELSPGRAVVVPMGNGGMTVETDMGVSFMRCVAPV